MNSELWGILSKDEGILEAFMDMRQAQPAKERLHYLDKVLEGSNQENAILLQKLYTDIISKSNIDFGSIPDSKGNILKYSEYKSMEAAISALNNLFEGKVSEDMKLLNGLHDMIISCRKDFEMGYNFDIEIIKIIYCTAVTSLHEMISLCVFEYTEKMRKTAGVNFNFANTKKKDILVLKNVRSLLKSYEKGQWKKMMDAFRKDPNLMKAGVANEGLIDFSVTANAAGIGKTIAGAGHAITNSPLFIPVAVIAAFILLFIIIRNLIYVFYCGAVSLRDYINVEKEIVDVAIKNESQNGTSAEVVKKHSRISDKLHSIANFIEVKILNSDKQARKELEKSNRENFSSSDFSNQAFGADMEF